MATPTRFYVGTATPTTTTLPNGGLYFNTSNKYIYLNNNGTLVSWNGNNNTYSVNNATLTIQKNGTRVGSFTANASSNSTVNITVPTKISELTNDRLLLRTDANFPDDSDFQLPQYGTYIVSWVCGDASYCTCVYYNGEDSGSYSPRLSDGSCMYVSMYGYLQWESESGEDEIASCDSLHVIKIG